MRKFSSALLTLAIALVAFSAHAGMSPDETVNTFKVADGLQATIFASEPEIVNPTSLDIDARGRVWIVEGANYRGSRTIRPEGDRIVILEDTDGDGKADSVKVFAQDKSLFCPLGICVIGNKVYVAQSPKMLVYTIDASGDKPVGPPEVMFSGFSGINHDHGLHAGMFGPDGRFYFNSGNSGVMGDNFDRPGPDVDASAEIKNSKGELIVDSLGSHAFPKGKIWRGKPKAGPGYTQGMAFRCNLDGSGFEVLGHNFRNNYKVCVDSFGTAWQSDNDDDGNQGVRLNYVMEGGNYGYTGPGGWSGDATRFPNQSQQETHWHNRQPGIVPNLYNTGGGSPTGICVYEGDLLPEKYRGCVIHTNAGGQWYGYVGAFISTPAGAGYKTELVELITNPKDGYFKPDGVCVAPDGSVFVSDWYDGQSGGHGMTDKTPGKQTGRIYRLAPAGNKAMPKPTVNLETLSGQIAAFLSPNVATQALGYAKLAASGPAGFGALQTTFEKATNPRHRARALWLMAQMPDGKAELNKALKDSDPNIRITALRAARLVKSDMISIATQMLGDNNIAVLREVALAMNYEPTEKALPILVALADKIDPAAPRSAAYDTRARGKSMTKIAEEEKERQDRVINRWYVEAVGIGCLGREKEVLEAWKANGKNKAATEMIEWLLERHIPEAPQTWTLLGPFPADGALTKEFGPEKKAGEIDFKASFKGADDADVIWGTLKGDNDKVNPARKVFGNNAVFAAELIESPEEQPATLLLGTTGELKVWLNGAEVDASKPRYSTAFASDVLDVKLNKGSNVLLVKFANASRPEAWEVTVWAKAKVSFKLPPDVPALNTAAKPAKK